MDGTSPDHHTIATDSVMRKFVLHVQSIHDHRSVTIGKAVTSIEYDAFSGCYKLVEVWNKSKLNITKASNSNGYVGYYALDVYKNKADKKIFTDGKGYVFYEGANECYLIRYTGKGTVLNLPTSCHGKNYAIYKYAFDHCNKLTNVTIPNSVTSIEDNAFSGCSKLKSIVIGSGVTFIGNDAFWNCSKLTNIHYNGTKEQWFFVVQNEPWDFENPPSYVCCSDAYVDI